MPSIILECPHCGAEKIGFALVYELEAHRPTSHPRKFRTVAVCSNCNDWIIAIFDSPSANQSPIQCPFNPTQMGWNLSKCYPIPQPSKCPSHTPDDLKRIFLQAANALKRGDSDASGAMSRKVVDVSPQQLLGEKSKQHGNIQGRLD